MTDNRGRYVNVAEDFEEKQQPVEPIHPRTKNLDITLWCFRVIFTVGVITAWCVALNFSTGKVQDFMSSCKGYECPDKNLVYINDTYCIKNHTISIPTNESNITWTEYIPTQCQKEFNDGFILLITTTWLLPFLGMLFGDENPGDIVWRRFCFIIEIMVNFLILWNNVYYFLIIDAIILYIWFAASPFLCGHKYKTPKI